MKRGEEILVSLETTRRVMVAVESSWERQNEENENGPGGRYYENGFREGLLEALRIMKGGSLR